MDRIISEDAQILAESNLPWERLNNKTILITGANGYVPSYFVYSILKRNDLYNSNIRVIALCRDETRALQRFQEYLSRKDFDLHIQDVCEPIQIDSSIHFFIHAASPSGSYSRHEKPADTYKTNVIGCLNLLELSRKNPVEGFLLISSVDVYGRVFDAERLTEIDYGYLDPLNPSNAYSMGKRASETLCAVYQAQYRIPITIVRPSQILGPGISLNDGRLHIDFISRLLSSNKIVLKGDGSPKRSFIYITDAISGMLSVLLKGSSGEAYNVCNEQGEASVLGFAEIMLSVVNREKKANFPVEFDITQRELPEVKNTVPCVLNDSGKLRKLGWQPQVSLESAVYRILKFYGVIE